MSIIYIIRAFRKLLIELKYYFIDRINRSVKVKKFESLNTIKLNLGCGKLLKKEFINIDLTKSGDLRLDLRKTLPFKNNSVDHIHSEHFFEYINYLDSTAINCLRDYLRVLKKGGKLTMILADMEKIFKAYVNKDVKFLEGITNITNHIPQSKKYASLIDYVNYVSYFLGYHNYCYDYEKICLLLKSVGFKNIKKHEFNPNELKGYDMYNAIYAFYVEAVK